VTTAISGAALVWYPEVEVSSAGGLLDASVKTMAGAETLAPTDELGGYAGLLLIEMRAHCPL
jgi:hypothetical protein